MRSPLSLQEAFGFHFEKLVFESLKRESLLPKGLQNLEPGESLARALKPHVEQLSFLFNRLDTEAQVSPGLEPYWGKGALMGKRAAYALYYLPMQVLRIGAIAHELHRLGFRFTKKNQLRAIEFGSGPGPGLPGFLLAQKAGTLGLENQALRWSLLEQDPIFLKFSQAWIPDWIHHAGLNVPLELKSFRKRLMPEEWLPKESPRFDLILMSCLINEIAKTPEAIAQDLFEWTQDHLATGGVLVIVEPALKALTRNLHQIRAHLIELEAKQKSKNPIKVLLPCLGHQSCGALSAPDDWCFEEVSWFRPPMVKRMDELLGLDHKKLAMSYLVITRSREALNTLLPNLQGPASERLRLVSEPNLRKPDWEFHYCSQAGKGKARFKEKLVPKKSLIKGDLLENIKIRGDIQAGRVEKTV